MRQQSKRRAPVTGPTRGTGVRTPEGRLALPKGLDKEKLRWIYEQMTLIRAFEEQLHEDVEAGKLAGFVHLYAGEEAVAVGVCACLRKEDYIASTHRGHGHCIAKGLDVRRMKAEILGRATGICKGKGGSMHIADFSLGMLGANGVVAAGIPLACGAALSAKVRGTDQVSVAFFGDGAANHGVFHESMNLAAVWNLPVLFVNENNGYADSTPIEYAARIERLSERAAAYGIVGKSVDGMDVFAVYGAAKELIEKARSGGGPSMLECRTYRYYGHYEGDPLTYRSREEEAEHKQRDCIRHFRSHVLGQNILQASDLDEIEKRSREAVAEASRFAEESPMPSPDQCLEDIFTDS